MPSHNLSNSPRRKRRLPSEVIDVVGEYACDDHICVDPSNAGVSLRKRFCGTSKVGDIERRCCRTLVAKIVKETSIHNGDPNAGRKTMNDMEPLLNRLSELLALYISKSLGTNGNDVRINKVALWVVTSWELYDPMLSLSENVRVTFTDDCEVKVQIRVPLTSDELKYISLATAFDPKPCGDGDEADLALVGTVVRKVFAKLRDFRDSCPVE